MKYPQADIYVHPEIFGVRMLDFTKVEEVFAQAAPAVDRFARQLELQLLAAGVR